MRYFWSSLIHKKTVFLKVEKIMVRISLKVSRKSNQDWRCHNPKIALKMDDLMS